MAKPGRGLERALDWEPGNLGSSLDFCHKHKVGMTSSTHWMFEQTPGDSEGQGSLANCSSQGCKESDSTEPLSKSNV